MEHSLFQMQSNGEYMMQKQFEIMLDISNKKITAELQNLKQMITVLNQEILHLKKQVQDAKHTQQSSPEPKPQCLNKESQPLKPRYGDFKPSDISINEFFYCGKKNKK